MMASMIDTTVSAPMPTFDEARRTFRKRMQGLPPIPAVLGSYPFMQEFTALNSHISLVLTACFIADTETADKWLKTFSNLHPYAPMEGHIGNNIELHIPEIKAVLKGLRQEQALSPLSELVQRAAELTYLYAQQRLITPQEIQ